MTVNGIAGLTITMTRIDAPAGFGRCVHCNQLLVLVTASEGGVTAWTVLCGQGHLLDAVTWPNAPTLTDVAPRWRKATCIALRPGTS